MFRTALIAGLTAIALVGPAAAGSLSNQNIGTVSNTAAGVGNTAVQSVTGVQTQAYKPYGYRPGHGPALSNSNLGSATNTAAGIGNVAGQNVQAYQYGGGHGSLFNSNIGHASNTAAGIKNQAYQSVTGIQR